jgi:hypothetical protein
MTPEQLQFPPRGLTYFWFLNDDLHPDRLAHQVQAFADGGAAAVVLHPRDGLLVPYLSREWFDTVRQLAVDFAARGIQSWLYDENYCPSGQADGWVVQNHPEFIGRRIERYAAPAELAPGQIFCCPSGELLWAGVVDPAGEAAAVDLTEQVGIIRRHWEVDTEWDSRWYYPATPLYTCGRSAAYIPEYGLRCPELPPGRQLVVFVARPVGRDQPWGALVDSLNPAATAAFIASTYDRYAEALGPMLGREVTAVFTDEPKMHDAHAYTPGMCDAFQTHYGYDLRPRLQHLFSDVASPAVMRTRLDYRQWIADRFRAAWLAPIADWCRDHDVQLVGHISPEDDPVQQAACLGNLFPLLEAFDLPGLDIIVPAVGDRDHALLNIGVTTATSCSQQRGRRGVISELLGASGLDLTPEQAGRIMGWQVLSGVSTPVVHAAFVSTMGLRLYDAPPDCGPESPRWPGICAVDAALRPFIAAVAEARQTAPVAILWPIRSFIAEKMGDYHGDYPTRDALCELLVSCLEAQVGVQLLDATGLWEAEIRDGRLQLGHASYSHVLLPTVTVIHRRTLDRLQQCLDAGIAVVRVDDSLQWVDEGDAVSPLCADAIPGERAAMDAAWCEQNLPRLAPVGGSGQPDLRASQWQRDGQMRTLLMNMGDAPCAPTAQVELSPGEFAVLTEQDDGWTETARFDPAALPPLLPAPETLSWADWQMRVDEDPWAAVAAPIAAYRWRPPRIGSAEPEHMVLTGVGAADGEPLAASLGYRATLAAVPAGRRALLELAPTAARGRITVRIEGWQETVSVDDLGVAPARIDVTAALTTGGSLVEFVFAEPQGYDGLHIAPTVFVE